MTTEQIDLSLLGDRFLRFAYAITSSHSERGSSLSLCPDGNTLLALLGSIFEKEYKRRQGKITSTETEKMLPGDFSGYSEEELEEAKICFLALRDTFVAEQPAVACCGHILDLIRRAQGEHGMGHA